VFKPIEPLILKSKVDVFVDLYRKTEEIRRQGEEERRLLIENLRVRGEKLAAEQALRRREEHQSLVLAFAADRALHGLDPGGPSGSNSPTRRQGITGFTGAFLNAGFDFGASHPRRPRRVLPSPALRGRGRHPRVSLALRDGTTPHPRPDVSDRDDEGSRASSSACGSTSPTQADGDEPAPRLEARGDRALTGGIAHDFNNMLSVVIGNLDLLQSSIEGNEKATRRARFALEGAQRCADLTNRLLAFSRRQPLQTSIVNLQDLVPTMLELLQRTLGERIDVQLKSPDGLWPVQVDATQFEAALVNLAVNARDAMPDGGSLTVEMANRTIGEGAPIGELTGDIVVTSITDTGTGMPPEVVAKVFEPFFTTKESGKGTGLGLSMVYGFVRQSGGHVEIDSVVGQGTTIQILLPRAQNDLVAAVSRPTTMLAPVRGDGETILVVEDDPKVRQVTASTLRSLGFQVREAENGDEAVVSLSQNDGVALVLSDIQMPGTLNGPTWRVRFRRAGPTSRCC
jgi:signal transduction histidine kinase